MKIEKKRFGKLHTVIQFQGQADKVKALADKVDEGREGYKLDYLDLTIDGDKALAEFVCHRSDVNKAYEYVRKTAGY